MTALAEALLDVVEADLTDVVADFTVDLTDSIDEFEDRLRLCSRWYLRIAS